MSINKKLEEQIGLAEQFGSFVKSKREQLGFCEDDVARYLGVSVDELRTIEGGRMSPPLNQLYALSNCLNIDPKFILKMVDGVEVLEQ
ncbi:MAG: helix-turn-helix domain-containing protein [Oligoflexia bacterium]|nr:helix-turn-helix domain-containing protein [Oligoflexia bacterium]